MERFSRSIEIDGQMWREDIAVNRAWATALRDARLLTASEAAKIQRGLHAIEKEFRAQRFTFLPEDEDIHVAIERRLTELIGATGAKIHTGRSRNDQVVTDFRLYLKRRVKELHDALSKLVAVLVQQAEASQEIILPAYTHTQQAQPIRLAHYLLALVFALRRHDEQLQQFVERTDEMPLGCGAVAGTAFPIDRNKIAQALGFRRVMQNSIDATGTRSFCGEIIFICSDICTTLSRYAHDFILWSTQEFGFIDLGEKFATGSSMMPNKKNPDAFELVRGKAGTLQGLLASIMSVQKGIPATYSRDLQEDKKLVFEALQTSEDCLQVFAGALSTCRFRAERMRAALDSALFATDIADYLVRKGIPFRKAHELVAQAVQYAERNDCGLHELSLHYWQKISSLCDEELFACFDAEASVERRNAIGGTSMRQVETQIRQAKNWLKKVAR